MGLPTELDRSYYLLLFGIPLVQTRWPLSHRLGINAALLACWKILLRPASRAAVVPPPVSLMSARAYDTVLAAPRVGLIGGEEDEWVAVSCQPVTCVEVIVPYCVRSVSYVEPDTDSLARFSIAGVVVQRRPLLPHKEST